MMLVQGLFVVIFENLMDISEKSTRLVIVQFKEMGSIMGDSYPFTPISLLCCGYH